MECAVGSAVSRLEPGQCGWHKASSLRSCSWNGMEERCHSYDTEPERGFQEGIVAYASVVKLLLESFCRRVPIGDYVLIIRTPVRSSS